VKAALHEVMYAETREQAREATQRFAIEYGAKYPKAVTTLEKDATCCSRSSTSPPSTLDMAQARWRRLDGAHLLPLVRAGIVFVDDVQQEGQRAKTRRKAA